ncbi:glyoxalase [Enterococcus villorum]|uniref:Glyoxalase n=3 Tax=Enterococcus villorum TaxID=112904 RepID=A0A1V8YAC9_9ENTE|nr:glyoxalase [Enterococcus villorum]OQO69558.1 glyoxalase [Enterococcus villorum]OQO72651.1 glyoxalase [Enterococcus villorum]
MIGKTRVMLYAEDVEILSRFFIEKLGATISETIDLPEACQSTIVTISSEFELGIFPKIFVQQFSPEVLGPPPSIIFFTEQFEEMYEKLENAGEIMENNGVQTFNFSDPEGNYFVIGKL